MDNCIDFPNEELGICFSIIKNEQEKIVGFRLSGDEQKPGGIFCKTFIKAAKEHEAYILTGDSSFTFVNHFGDPRLTIYSIELEAQIFSEIKNIISNDWLIKSLEDPKLSGFEMMKVDFSNLFVL